MSVLVFIGWLINLVWYKPFSVDLFYERMFIEYGLQDPELMSRLGLDKRYGIYFLNDELTNISTEQAQKRYNDIVDRNLVMLNSYKVSEQSEEQLLSSAILGWYLENEVLRFHASDQDYLINHVRGVQLDLPRFMVQVHQIENLHDAENYLARLSQFPEKFDQLMSLLNEREGAGVLAPKFIIDKVIVELETFLEKDIKYNVLYRDFIYKVEKAPYIREVAIPELRFEIKSRIEDEVYPAYRSLLVFLRDQRSRANNIVGAWSLPNGHLYYTSMRQTHTTLDKEANEMHGIGLREVSKIEQQLRVLFDSLRLPSEQSTGQILEEIAQNPDFYYPDTEAGRKMCLQDYQHLVDSISQFLPELYLHYPEDSIVVKRLPIFREDLAPLLSYQPPEQPHEPATFFANLKDMQQIPKYKMPVIVFHEMLGDYVQRWYEFQLQHVPTFRKELRFRVFTEGWSLYIEQLAEEQGYFKDDYAHIGKLQNELFMAARLVVDTGIHSEKWSRDKATNYLVETTGLPHHLMQAEVDKCIVEPGEGCLYKIGQLEFLQLREKVEKELGDLSNLKVFHDFVLKNGNMPLPVLQKQIDKYINHIKNPTKGDGLFD